MSKCREAFEEFQSQHEGDDFINEDELAKFMWNSATKNAVKICDRFDFCGNEILIAEAIEQEQMK